MQGVLDPADAELAIRHGADGIVVSNHGGRQLDYAPTALDMLPAVVAAVGGRVPIWCDGGVRRGTDVFKALALGATGVLLGRPVLYALALGGAGGVARALDLLQREFELAMALAGCQSVKDITSQHLLRMPGAGLQRVGCGTTCCQSGGQCCQKHAAAYQSACKDQQQQQQQQQQSVQSCTGSCCGSSCCRTGQGQRSRL
jgi:hypothetical protein